jgi:uncharacterized protein (TIGR00369 family)
MAVTADDARRMLDELFAPWVPALGLRVESVGDGGATLVLPFDPKLARTGGTVCGQALMAAADTAMVVALAAHFGEFRPCTTVTLNTSFLRPVSSGDVRVAARVLRAGRSLAFGEIELSGAADGRLAGHATTTYALL